MKKILSLLLGGMLLVSLASCSDSDYDEKYADPSTTSTVGVPQVFTAVMYKGSAWMDLVYYRYYTQSTTSGIFSGVIGDDNSRGRFRGASEGYFNTRWQNFYDMLTQFRLLEYTYENLEAEEQASNLIFYHLGRTLIYAQLHEMLSLWGDVPFTGAGTLWMNGDYESAKNQAVYDDDVTLYKQILSDLKETATYLAGSVDATGLSSLGRQDYSKAAGDQTMWQKYVNSLRLRIALHLATAGDCTSDACSAIAEILNNPDQYPVIDDNSENMGVDSNTSSDTFNYGKAMSQALRTGSYAAGSQTILNVMNVPSDGVPDENTDPRLPAMYDCNPDGAYIAFDVSMTNTEITNLGDEKELEYVQRGMNNANYYCEIDTIAIAGYASYQGNENLSSIWINAAEVSLSKAEAYLMGYGVTADAAKAKSCFIEGIEQSNEFYWDMKEGSTLHTAGNDSYYGYRELVRPSDDEVTAYAESIWDATEETVCSQLWLNFSFMNELEAWNVVRRTGYPVVNFSRDTQVSSYPTPPNRLPYPSDELNYNSENCQNAISTNYDESTGYYTNLFWAIKTYYNMID